MMLGTAGAEHGELHYKSGLHSFPLHVHNLSFLTVRIPFDLPFIIVQTWITALCNTKFNIKGITNFSHMNIRDFM
jgi:hypothetical protein